MSVKGRIGVNWKNWTGHRFGKLTVLGDAAPRQYKNRIARVVRCRCDCGNEIESLITQLKGRTYGCGCYRREKQLTHGMSKTRTYRIWWGMVLRGTGKMCRKNYADKGITVCDRWLTFENFLEDMGERPGPKMTVERIDNLKGYSPKNCKWATYDAQARNRCTNSIYEYRGESMCVTDLAKKVGMDLGTLCSRLKQMSVEDAVNTPIKRTPVEFEGRIVSLKQACREAGLKYPTVVSRMANGWSVAAALNTPCYGSRRQQFG